MDNALSPELSAFRDEVRRFIADNLPEDLRRAARRTPSVFHDPDVSLPWQRILNARGWAAPDWPKEFGGPGWDAVQRYIFISECVAADAPNLAPMGLKMVAPVLMHYGTPQQQAYYLPRILSGEDYWCQGFSEPGSGSDLASLRLRADRDGSDYVLNGSKIWTTHAHFANRMFCLVRTSAEGKPQAGISFLLIDMDTPGIRVSPIHTLAGDHELNQVFFDDVRVPQANRLGAENDGWSVAKYLLAFERGGVYAPALVARLREVERACPDDPVLHHRIARQAVSLEALQAIEMKALRKEGPTAMYPSILKVLGTEASQAIDVLACDILGTPGWRAREADLPDDITVTVPRYLNNRASSIYAGSNEIQRDIIAKMMLG